MVTFDPYDPVLVDDPYPTYAALRAEAPAYYGEAHDFWALSRFDDVKAALGDHETYCSSQGLLVIRGGETFAAPEFPPGNMLLMDPPQHTAYRRLVSRRFLLRDVAGIEPRIRQTAHRLIDGFAERGSADLVADYAVALPAMVFATMLGIPDADWDAFQQCSARLVSPAPTPEAMAEHHHAVEEVSQLFAALLTAKREHPADDLLSEVATGEVDGHALTLEEFVGFAVSMLIAGNDTTSNALASGAYLFDRHRDQRTLCLDDPGLLVSATEEVLRVEPPVHGLARTLTRDVELHGRRMTKGTKVLLLFGSANRDERIFPDADRFQVTRAGETHLAFGFGIHHCVGIHLGRLETRLGLETLLARLPDYRVAVDDVHWRQAIPTRPMASLPVEFEPAPAVS